MVILYVCTGTKYSQWWVDNLRYMLRNHIGIKFAGVTKGEGSVFDKLKLFKYFKTDDYIYFDLDVVIRKNILHLFRKKFTLLKAWWRHQYHTPLNSSIMSWHGDHSHIYIKFKQNEDYYRLKYHQGIDEYIYHEVPYNVYNKVCWSWQYDQRELHYSTCLFNQNHTNILNSSWTHKYLLSA